MRGYSLSLLCAALVVASTAASSPRRCAPGGNVCNTLVPEKAGCCTPKKGTPFQTGQCDCRTCHLGSWRAGLCPASCFCPAVFKPVCCLLNGKAVTKGNACECGCAGGTTKRNGQCDDPRPCICPAVFKPVCCLLKTGEKVTKGNSCGCTCVGGKTISEGACKNPGSCVCPEIFDPACCKRKKDGKLFEADNKCTCECEGTIIGRGKCPAQSCATVKCANCVDTIDGPKCSPPITIGPPVTIKPPVCPCPKILRPTCCKRDGTGDLFRASNTCTCDCVGTVIGPGSCPSTSCATLKCANCRDTINGPVCSPPVTIKPPSCPCPRNLDPTCCKNKKTGLLFDAANPCVCRCTGTVLGKGKCPKITCANVRCAGPCTDTIDGPKCGTRPPVTTRPRPTCASTLCSTRTPCCIETRRGPRCVSRQHRRCPSRVTCRTVKCGRPRTCCIETWRGPKCVSPKNWRCRIRYRRY